MIQNVNGTESCAGCEDTGWVILLGTVKVGTQTYERGCAACQWCERGGQAFKANGDTVSQYDAADMDLPVDPKVRRLWPSEYARTREGKADPHVGVLMATLTPRRGRSGELERAGEPDPFKAANRAGER